MDAVQITEQVASGATTGGISGPLSALYQGSGLSVLKYPNDLGSTSGKNSKNHYRLLSNKRSL